MKLEEEVYRNTFPLIQEFYQNEKVDTKKLDAYYKDLNIFMKHQGMFKE
jgi:hypothetical protein